VRRFSHDLIKRSLVNGGGKDVMSVLMRANASETPNNQMSDEEVAEQIACVISL
jgi:hypothetical protein